jgi:hypothetical protein
MMVGRQLEARRRQLGLKYWQDVCERGPEEISVPTVKTQERGDIRTTDALRRHVAALSTDTLGVLGAVCDELRGREGALTLDERELLANYRAAPDAGRVALRACALAMGRPGRA